MPQTVSGKRYAQAIFELALENDQVGHWAEDLALVAEAFRDPQFAALLKHADVAAAEKLRATAAVLAGVNPLIRNMVDLLVSKGQVDAIPGAYTGYTELLDQHLGRQRVEVTSAVQLEDAEIERVNRFVAELVQREVVITTRVDESILGGVVIQIGDRLLDGSTQARLDHLREQLHSNASAPTG
jgi:F-type H+-transporting ATPase subunit delta